MRCVTLFLLSLSFATAQALEVKDLRCENGVAPVGVDVMLPALSWRMEQTGGPRGQKQTAYQIIVSSTTAKLAANDGDLWNSGQVSSEQSLRIAYACTALTSRQRCHWKVRVWDKDGNPSAWSAGSAWTMGLLNSTDWSAKWINHTGVALDGAQWIWFNEGNPANSAPAATRQFRRTIALPTNRVLTSAKVRITADNSFTLSINGQSAASGNEWTRPGSEEITSLFNAGNNSVAISATNGGTAANPTGLIARFEFTFATGAPLIVITDSQWEASTNGTQWSNALSLGNYGIAPWNTTASSSSSDPWLRGEFDLTSAPSAAIVTVHSHAYFELYINGQKVGEDVLTPAVSDSKARTFTVTYDVASLLTSGRNCIGLWMSKGWADRVAVRAQLDAVVGGANFTYGTGLDWKSRSSGYSHIGDWKWANFGGERVDAAAHRPNWSQPLINTASWSNVVETTAPAGPPSNHHAPLNRIGKRIPATEITALAGERYVIDFGTNLSGWLELKFPQLTSGQVIRMHFADRVFPNGVHTSPIGNIAVSTNSCISFPRVGGGNNLYQIYNQTSEFISAGGANEVFSHKFNYAGFRYVVVEGLPAAPSLADATALLVEADLADAGTFESSDTLLNRIHQANRWTQRCLNLGSYYVDCPHRERMGYGDGQVALQGMMMNFNASDFYTKWVEDWRLALENKNQSLAYIAPPFEPTGGGPAWPGNIARIPWQHYLHYGDPSILEENIDAARSYCQYLDGRSTNDILRDWGGGFSFIGDWVPPGRGMDTNNWPSSQMAEFFSNCYRIHLWQLVGKMATALGRTSEAQQASQRATAISNATHAAFFDATNKRYVIDEQIYYAFPLMFGLTPAAERTVVLENLVRCIVQKNSGHLDTGMLGTLFLMEFLNDIGRDDIILGMYQKTTYPGWGYMVEQGATTLWEQWNGHFSQIHSCFTSADNWLYQGLAGIRPDPAKPGFKNVIIAPAEVGDITWVNASHIGPYGNITSYWTRAGANVSLQATIPPNSTAEIHVPANAVGDVTESGLPVSSAPGVQFLRMENRHAVFSVGSGTYNFTGVLPITLGPVVNVPTGSPLALNFSGSHTVAALLLGGVTQPPGTYSATTHPAWFTGTGSLLVVPQAGIWNNSASTGKWNATDANWSGQTWAPGSTATLAHSATPSTIMLEGNQTASVVGIGNNTNNAAYTLTGPGSLVATNFNIQGLSSSDLASIVSARFTDATINISGDLGLGRAGLIVGGSSVVTADRLGGSGIGSLASADWGLLTLQDNAQLTVTNGILGNTTAWGVILNGGTLTTKGINYGPHTYNGSTNLIFNGTLLRANQNNANFLTVSGGLNNDGPTAPVIQAGGAKFDTQGFNISLGLALTGSGPLIKSGSGKLTLDQTHTYQGTTTVQAGTLAVTGSLGTGNLAVSNGAVAELLNPAGTVANTASVGITGTGRIHLAAGVTETVSQLYIDGVLRAAGTWNATRDPLHFSGTGNLIVTNSGTGLVPITNPIVYSDGRPYPAMRMDATDVGKFFDYGSAPNQSDYRGAREALINQVDGKFYLFYDGAGLAGWLACLAESTDMINWTRKGAVLDLGAPGSEDSASASAPWIIKDENNLWHMFYLGTPNASPWPDYVPNFPYLTMRATAPTPGGPWTKQYLPKPFRPVPNTYYSAIGSPGHVVKQGSEYRMFFSSTDAALKRTLSIARTQNLAAAWTVDPAPALPVAEQIENSTLYFEPSNSTWFLFTNHVGIENGNEYTDGIWVYWSTDLNTWDPANKAVVLDGSNCNWSSKCIGMPSVTAVGDKLHLFYDAPGGTSTSHMLRSLGRATLQLPLIPSVLGDEVNPSIQALSPAHTDTTASSGANLVMTFSEAVKRGTGNIVIRQYTGGAVVETIPVTSSAVSVNGAVVTINPANILADNVRYFIEIGSGAITDFANNSFPGIVGNGTWNFTTGVNVLTTLLADNFNSQASFSATPNADQSGILAPATYTFSNREGISYGNPSRQRRGNGVLDLAYDGTATSQGARVFTNADFASFANTYNSPIRISFDISAPTDWVGFVLGTTAAWVDGNGGTTEFSALFSANGTGNKWVNGSNQGATAVDAASTVILEIRDTVGTGSAFNGGGSVAQLWRGTTDLGSYTLEQLSASNSKLAFCTWNGSSTAGKSIDNLKITGFSPVVGGFTGWINAFNFPAGADKTPTGDPDNDGIPNSVEMVLGGNPATGMDTALMPTLALETDPVGLPTGDYFIFTYRRAAEAIEAGMTSICEIHTDLAGAWTKAEHGVNSVVEVVNANFAWTNPPATNTDRVRVHVPRGMHQKLFGRLKVAVP